MGLSELESKEMAAQRRADIPVYLSILMKDNISDINDEKIIAKHLRKGIKFTEMPKWMYLWIFTNFYKAKGVTRLCMLAGITKDDYFKWALLNTVKYRRPIKLKRPIWVKLK